MSRTIVLFLTGHGPIHSHLDNMACQLCVCHHKVKIHRKQKRFGTMSQNWLPIVFGMIYKCKSCLRVNMSSNTARVISLKPILKPPLVVDWISTWAISIWRFHGWKGFSFNYVRGNFWNLSSALHFRPVCHPPKCSHRQEKSKISWLVLIDRFLVPVCKPGLGGDVQGCDTQCKKGKSEQNKKRLVSAQHAKFIASSLLFFYVFGPSPSFLRLLEALHVRIFPPHEYLYRLSAAVHKRQLDAKFQWVHVTVCCLLIYWKTWAGIWRSDCQQIQVMRMLSNSFFGEH